MTIKINQKTKTSHANAHFSASCGKAKNTLRDINQPLMYFEKKLRKNDLS